MYNMCSMLHNCNILHMGNKCKHLLYCLHCVEQYISIKVNQLKL